MSSTLRFPVVIVGAGLAGLAAASELGRDQQRVLVLEAEPNVGGKIITRHHGGITYETGALFAYDPQWAPFPVASGPLECSAHPLGLFHKGKLVTGASVINCLQALQPDVRNMLCLKSFLAAPFPNPAMVGEDLSMALQAFFRVIHPGNLHEYTPSRRWDSLVRHDTHRFRNGNISLVEGLAEQDGVEIRTGCQVRGLEHDVITGQTTVRWQTAAGREQHAVAERVILATPAAAARELCRGATNVATDFLGRVQYGGGVVVVLYCCGADLQPYSYVVSTQGLVNTFVFHRSAAAPETVVLTAYLVAEQATACRDLSDAEQVALVRNELNGLGIGEVAPQQVVFSEVKHWPAVGPIINNEIYGGFSNARLRPLPGVVLAGDYTWWNEQQMPYGMWAAIASGRRAAKMCREPALLPVQTDFAAEPLAMTWASRMTGDGPKGTERLQDGTIAYYGLVLQAQPDRDLEQYLLGEAVDGLWGYQQGYGVTSLDSALVMEGLLTTGRHHALVRTNCRRLVEAFYDHQSGAFWTIAVDSSGRAPYWRGPDCPATAFCGWLLHRIDPGRYAAQIVRCRQYLLSQQRVTGGWPGKWFPSKTLQIWYAVRFLAATNDDAAGTGTAAAACRRAALWLTSRQEGNGSWGESVIETSAALLALDVTGDSREEQTRGREWLKAQQTGPGWLGEPILEYWFEDEGRRTLFHTRDCGRITTAWATLALGSGEPEEQGACTR
jgi:protoporphyrinogen oxidase